VQEEEDLARAMKEVERKRLEMQRAAERVEEPAELEAGMVVKRKSKKKARSGVLPAEGGEGDGGVGVGEDGVKKKKKKKKVKDVDGSAGAGGGGDVGEKGEEEDDAAAPAPVKAKKKKKRQVTFDEA
jgi:AP-3 complex subunit delta-1